MSGSCEVWARYRPGRSSLGVGMREDSNNSYQMKISSLVFKHQITFVFIPESESDLDDEQGLCAIVMTC
jgi:hypothetical protein